MISNRLNGLFVVRQPNGLCVDHMLREITIERIVKERPAAVYTSGSYENLPIIEALYGSIPIYICAPRFWRGKNDIEAFKFAMSLDLPPIYGGFREITETDLILLRYRAGMAANSTDNLQQEKDAILSLPVISRLRFVSTLNESYIPEVVAYIHDPRWFTYPDMKPRRLQKFLSLYQTKNEPLDKRAIYQLVVSCWYDEAKTTMLRRLRSYHLTLTARDFLLKEWYASYLIHDNVKAELKTTKKFVTFLFYVWLDTLYPNMAEPFFEPEMYFKDQAVLEEWEAWNQWLNAASREHGSL